MSHRYFRPSNIPKGSHKDYNQVYVSFQTLVSVHFGKSLRTVWFVRAESLQNDTSSVGPSWEFPWGCHNLSVTRNTTGSAKVPKESCHQDVTSLSCGFVNLIFIIPIFYVLAEVCQVSHVLSNPKNGTRYQTTLEMGVKWCGIQIAMHRWIQI